MSSDEPTNRPNSGQRLPISLSVPRARAWPGTVRPGAAFLAHLLSGKPNIAQPRPHAADRLYRQAEASDIKRLPPGFRKNLSA